MWDLSVAGWAALETMEVNILDNQYQLILSFSYWYWCETLNAICHGWSYMVQQEIAFFDVTRTGELLSRLSEDTQIIKNAATTNLSEALRNLTTAFIGIGFMFSSSWKLTCNWFYSLTAMFITLVPILLIVCFFLLSVGFGRSASHFHCCSKIWALSSWTFSLNSSCSCSGGLNCGGLWA